MAPVSASLVVSLVPSHKLMFVPAALSMSYSQSRRVIIQLREALETNAFMRLSFSTTVAGLSISPSSVEWTAGQNHTTGRSIVVTAAQPITTSLSNAITVTVTTTDTGYLNFLPSFTVATIATPSPVDIMDASGHLILDEVLTTEVEEVAELETIERVGGGFGSTDGPALPPAVVCASSTDSSNALAVSVVGGQYYLESSLSSRNVGANTYHFSSIPSGHPMKVWQDDGAAGCTVTMASCEHVVSTDYCWGAASWTVSSGCAGQSLSLRCAYHGAMGGTDRLVFNDSC